MKVRLWKLGSLEYQIIPKPATIKKMREVVKELTKNEADVINYVCGPDLSIEEYSGDFSSGKLLTSGKIVQLSQEQKDLLNQEEE